MRKIFGWGMMCVAAMMLSGCMSMRSAKVPVYQRMDPKTPGSTLVLNQKIDPFMNNRYVEATIDGYAVTDKKFLSYGQKTVNLDAGSHELKLSMDKRKIIMSDIGPLPKKPVVVKFKTAPGKKYRIDISKKTRKLLWLGLGLKYTGWSDEEISSFPREGF